MITVVMADDQSNGTIKFKVSGGGWTSTRLELANDKCEFRTGANREKFSIYNDRIHALQNAIIDGNVGIGTPSPSVKLHIFDTSNNTQLILGEDNATDKAGIVKYFQGKWFQILVNAAICIGNQLEEIMKLQVSVGKPSLSAKKGGQCPILCNHESDVKI